MVFVTFKYIIIGDSEVGKSSLLMQFTEEHFQPVHDLTIGVEFGSKMVTIDDREIKLEMWDTAGQETFLSITRSYYRGADGALLVFDITRRATFEHIERWMHEARENSHNKNLRMIVVGMKSDKDAREVGSKEAADWARRHGMSYIEASAKTAQNVEEVFVVTARQILEKYDNARSDPGVTTVPKKAARVSLKGEHSDLTRFSNTDDCC